ncbi:hypothetical protein Bca52824_023709 [Brassica carinata]|uniref:Uncharacterized protein n=1 Tax=Brassica carinata TaxID=52824 RepID=A0A8X7VJ38_BRACI|nr:hypothetical protein Bca52824_023709 [Brassica carinata]
MNEQESAEKGCSLYEAAVEAHHTDSADDEDSMQQGHHNEAPAAEDSKHHDHMPVEAHMEQQQESDSQGHCLGRRMSRR